MTEGQLQAAVVDLCDRLGLLWWHDTDSRRNAAGFLDLVIVGSTVLYVELKTDKGRIRPEQQIWIDALNAAGQTAVVWRPQHLKDGTIAGTLTSMNGRKPGRAMARLKAEKQVRTSRRTARPSRRSESPGRG